MKKSIEKAKQRQSTEPRLVTKKIIRSSKIKAKKTIEELKENRAEAIKKTHKQLTKRIIDPRVPLEADKTNKCKVEVKSLKPILLLFSFEMGLDDGD